jgi:dodecin
MMSVAKTIEIEASSPVSFDAAIKEGIERACQTLENVKGAWIQDQEMEIENGKVTAYNVRMKVTFILR